MIIRPMAVPAAASMGSVVNCWAMVATRTPVVAMASVMLSAAVASLTPELIFWPI